MYVHFYAELNRLDDINSEKTVSQVNHIFRYLNATSAIHIHTVCVTSISDLIRLDECHISKNMSKGGSKHKIVFNLNVKS